MSDNKSPIEQFAMQVGKLLVKSFNSKGITVPGELMSLAIRASEDDDVSVLTVSIIYQPNTKSQDLDDDSQLNSKAVTDAVQNILQSITKT